MKFSILIVRLLLICLIGLIWPMRALAAGEFGTNYDVSYAVAPNGKTIVTMQIRLVNKTSNTYPKNFSIVLDTLNLTNVIAYDDGGVIVPGVTQKDSKTHILVNFNRQVVGLGKQLTFTLRYETPDVAKKLGSIWEITIPGILANPDIENYTVSYEVPSTFGPLIYQNPAPAAGRRFNKAQMLSGGISAAYGSSQNMQLDLIYKLTNSSEEKTKQEITIPPDGAYQRVTLKSIVPEPEAIQVDEDGNWLAQYTLTPASELIVKVKLVAELFFQPREGYSDPAPNENYKAGAPYWEADNEKIREIAQIHSNPRAIYDFVVATLSYDYDRISNMPKRQGAVEALLNPQGALCMEFTDLFIAVARAAGISARRVVGYAHTSNAKLRPLSLSGDVLHAWPEYYNTEKQLWIPVDPTWADTTGGVNYFDQLDLNHVAFAINGISSTAPISAGMYVGEKGKKNIEVSFVDKSVETTAEEKLKTVILFPQEISGGLINTGKVIVQNLGTGAVNNINIRAQAQAAGWEVTKFLRKLPPFGRVEIPIKIKSGHFLSFGTGDIQVSVNGANSYWPYEVRPSQWFLFGVITFPIVVILTLTFVRFRKRLWSLLKRK